MPRRSFLRYTKADVLEEERAYLLHFPPETLYRHWQDFPAVTSEDLFACTLPLELEVGCGSAEFLCSLAAKRPDTNFVGIDISEKLLSRAVEIASSLHLANIKFIHADFRLMYPLFRPDSLQAVYLHFPDPHLKPRCQKRRLLNSAFLDLLSLALIRGGQLSVMTDLEAFFLDMLLLVEQDPRFEKVHAQRYLIGFEPEVKSLFQRVWEQHGEQVFRFEVRKKDIIPESQ